MRSVLPNDPWTRRRVLLGAASIGLAACGHKTSSGLPLGEVEGLEAGLSPPGGSWREASWPPAPDYPDGELAHVLLPDVPAKAPLLIALHGRGETRSVSVGAAAWPVEYQLDRLHRRLLAPPLTGKDLLDMYDPGRLAKLNASLATAPYQGLVVGCPWAPDLHDKSPAGAQGYAKFLTDELLPRMRKESGSTLTARETTGIDGVSMGGRLSLLVGLTHPEIFGRVGALQPALGVAEAAMVSDLAKAAMARAPVKLRLVSSLDDPFLPAVHAASMRMKEDGVPHEILLIPGTHGYEFNRGPGGVEMLLWHERTARGLAL